MSFVIDTSATMPWCFPDEQTAQSESLLDRLTGDEAYAPAIWTLEVANTLSMAKRKGRISVTTVDAFVGQLRRLKVNLDHDHEARAFSMILALSRRHALTTYDASYLELAMRLSLPLATRDTDLKRAAQSAGIELIPA